MPVMAEIPTCRKAYKIIRKIKKNKTLIEMFVWLFMDLGILLECIGIINAVNGVRLEFFSLYLN